MKIKIELEDSQLDWVIGQLETSFEEDQLSDFERSAWLAIRHSSPKLKAYKNNNSVCPECGSYDCNGECSIDDSMFGD